MGEKETTKPHGTPHLNQSNIAGKKRPRKTKEEIKQQKIKESKGVPHFREFSSSRVAILKGDNPVIVTRTVLGIDFPDPIGSANLFFVHAKCTRSFQHPKKGRNFSLFEDEYYVYLGENSENKGMIGGLMRLNTVSEQGTVYEICHPYDDIGTRCTCYKRIRGLLQEELSVLQFDDQYKVGRTYFVYGIGRFSSEAIQSSVFVNFNDFCVLVSLDGHFFWIDTKFIHNIQFNWDHICQTNCTGNIKEKDLPDNLAVLQESDKQVLVECTNNDLIKACSTDRIFQNFAEIAHIFLPHGDLNDIQLQFKNGFIVNRLENDLTISTRPGTTITGVAGKHFSFRQLNKYAESKSTFLIPTTLGSPTRFLTDFRPIGLKRIKKNKTTDRVPSDPFLISPRTRARSEMIPQNKVQYSSMAVRPVHVNTYDVFGGTQVLDFDYPGHIYSDQQYFSEGTFPYSSPFQNNNNILPNEEIVNYVENNPNPQDWQNQPVNEGFEQPNNLQQQYSYPIQNNGPENQPAVDENLFDDVPQDFENIGRGTLHDDEEMLPPFDDSHKLWF